MMTTTDEKLDAALAYAARGWHVVPLHYPRQQNDGHPCSCLQPDCKSIGKHPHTRNGLKDATTDADTIRQWWQSWPHANVAIVTGAISGIFVVDVDPRHGGDVTLAELEAAHGPLPATVEAVTGGAGRHLIYRHPGNAKVKNDSLGKMLGSGLDVRGDGGYIVAAPSLHASGNHYLWELSSDPADVEPVPAPQWLLDRVTEAAKPLQQKTTTASTGETICDGNRNATLTSLAGTMRRKGMTPAAIEAALMAENSTRCIPPLDAAEVATIAHSVSRYEPADDATGTGTGGKATQADKLVALASDVELFTDGENAYATVTVNGHRENHQINRKGFRDWLARRYWEEHRKAPSAQPLQDAIGVLTGKATYEGARHDVAVRVGTHDRAVYLDLCNDDWEAVEVTQDGWRVISDPPVRFIRRNGMLPLPRPVWGGGVEELRPLINAGDDDNWRLMVGWLLGALHPHGPYPILAVNGEQGSAKSTTCRMLRGLIDPHTADLQSPPRDSRDLIVSAFNARAVGFDNLSSISPEMSDALCRLATGEAFTTRTLYSDQDQTMFKLSRPIILNGIGDIAARPDLLERALPVMLPTIPPDQRQTEGDLWSAYSAARPRILGALLTALSDAIDNLPCTRVTQRPRMADFAEWMAAAEPALPWAEGEFMRTYGASQEEGTAAALESSAIGSAVIAFTTHWGEWTGTASELLAALNNTADDGTKRRKDWPQYPNGLSGALMRLAPALRKVGISVERGKSKTARSLKLTARINHQN